MSSPSTTATGQGSPLQPSPLAIGRTFLKQYYQVLTTTPDMISKFYRPLSVLSHGEGNHPTIPTTMESLGDSPTTKLKERFFSSGASDEQVRFELEHGAIDAQESVNGGVLLVVTGHMYLGEVRRAFCHTFFLNAFSAPQSKIRQFYVHNDVLRFLQQVEPNVVTTLDKEAPLSSVQEEEEETVANSTATAPVPDDTNKNNNNAIENNNDAFQQSKDTQQSPAVVEQSNPPVTDTMLPSSSPPTAALETTSSSRPVENDIESVGGVEETKEEPPLEDDEEDEDDQDFAQQEGMQDADHTKTRNQSTKPNGNRDRHSRVPTSSWASLVASGATVPATTAATNAQSPPPKPTNKSAQKSTPNKSSKANENNSKNNVDSSSENNKEKSSSSTPPNTATNSNPTPTEFKARHKRDPDCTIVIKNVPHDTKEGSIRALFEPFALQANASIIGINVSAHKGLAFVDYNTPAPVLAILEKDKSNGSFILGGRTLEVEQKTLDIKRREGRRGNNNRDNHSFRSGSPAGNGYRRGNNNNNNNNNSNNNNSNSNNSDRHHHSRRNGGGRSDRGSRNGRGR